MENIGGDQSLGAILSAITEPPLYWNALVDAHKRHELPPNAEHGFAWLVFSLLHSPVNNKQITKIAREVGTSQVFLHSASTTVRHIGRNINNILQLTSLKKLTKSQAGGRHDNDFQDFRDVSILPTPAEIAYKDTPFYRRLEEVYNANVNSRPSVHRDNQFRLLREDLLSELCGGLEAALSHRTAEDRIENMTWDGVVVDSDGRRRHLRVTFRCHEDQNKASEDNRKFIKHEKFGCLMSKGDAVAFGTIDRNTSSLLDNVPTLAIKITGGDSLRRILQRSADKAEFSFVAVNTPVFAYQPILKRLQEQIESPLSDTLLALEPLPKVIDLPDKLSQVIKEIHDLNGRNIHRVLRLKTEVSLDRSQLDALMAGLKQSVSIIEGPPGMSMLDLY